MTGKYADSDDQSATSQCCYTPFHLKCIKSWATKSVHDTREAFRARGETKPGEWRCPGCQKRRLIAPNAYWCFCGSIQNPHTSRLATPHSCANACTRRRPCGHACPLQCHPGPCPPCQVVVQLKCFCKQKTKTFHCCELYTVDSTPKQPDLCCDRKCSKSLTCGRHFCQLLCHEGDCPLCDILERGKCYCGKVDRELKCGESDAKDCEIVNDVLTSRWIGRFDCGQRCNRLFDCGVHKCPQTCHVPSNSAPKCPLSPSVLTHCPCGKEFISQLDRGVRTSCVDAIPTCKQLCMKALGGCDHFCSAPCHTGDCPSCSVELSFPCRCGSTLRIIQCHERVRSQHDEVLCENRCSALRSCGRHQCNRVCCPLASLSSTSRGKKKSKVLPRSVVDDGGWHECDLTCGKLLSCGNHHCEQRDHQGLCPPCLRSTFTEIACRCGKTVLEPPIPCGIGIECSYPCSRPPPACGHPIVPHNCHEDTQTCPPCPFLTSKACACGKGIKNNVRCSQEKVSCGAKCDRLLDCGFHRCDRLCHGDDCGTCKQTCGKPPNHPCTSLCHAPASCPESDPCRSSVTLSCPCGRLQQASQCGRSAPNPAGRQGQQQLSCTKECQVAQRNARLAEALNISAGVRDREGIKPTVYKDELLQFAKRDPKFCDLVEKTFAEFIDSKKKSLVLPRTPESRRVFVRGLAAMYRMDTELLDAEPQRSVQIIRRIDTRVPHPLLSSAIESFKSRLGKLVDMGDLQSRNHKQSRPFLNSSATENTMQVKVDVTPGAWVVPQRRVTQVPSTVQNQPDVSTSSDTNLVPENWEDDNTLGDE